jgi:imidazolonepropionase-like amidohydrolase
MTRNILLFSLIALAGACLMSAEQKRQAPPKTAIINANVWNGSGFTLNKTVVLIGGIITNAPSAGATTVDAKGGYLIPGLIDTHCHIQSCSYLTAMRQYGVTTALDMGTYPYSSVTACRASGVTDVYGPGAGGTVNGTLFSHLPEFPSDSLIPNPAAGRKFVADRVAQGVDYIKILLDPLGPDDETIAAVVQAAHAAGKLVISHAPTFADYSQAETGHVDIPCHAPLDIPLNTASVTNLTSARTHVVPTLIMMQSIVNNTGQPYSHYTLNAEASVTSMYNGGVPILVGTDANLSPYVPANPPFGLSIHEELALLVAAGVSPINAIRGATSLAASTFRLYDRGSITPGLRADLVLLSADPTVDISNSRSIERVWIQGVETDPSS